jgi:hypothetical protein
MPASSRRRFLKTSASLAGRVAASGAVSLPILASLSKRARALGWGGWKDRGGPSEHCFLSGTRIQTPGGEIPV